ncbi:hypothetical protein HDU85_007479 [Gaertneriomyces sp. JEL0708]|nr:hypothetical protein HDU85_007479 [Gaertneriomyces sp. JEL0708]
MSHAYRELIRELGKVTAWAPRGKAPKLFNYHKYVATPYTTVQESSFESIKQIPLRAKSEQYAASGRLAANPEELEQSTILRDIPLPAVLMKHIHQPSPTLSQGKSLGKITGFRIEVTGRRGTRSSTQRLAYGRLGTGDIGGSTVDFARSLYVHKKGVTGVKVWIGYGR